MNYATIPKSKYQVSNPIETIYKLEASHRIVYLRQEQHKQRRGKHRDTYPSSTQIRILNYTLELAVSLSR